MAESSDRQSKDSICVFRNLQPPILVQTHPMPDQSSCRSLTVSIDGPGRHLLIVDLHERGVRVRLIGRKRIKNGLQERAAYWPLLELNVRPPVYIRARVTADLWHTFNPKEAMNGPLDALLEAFPKYLANIAPACHNMKRKQSVLDAIDGALRIIQRHIAGLLVPHACDAISRFPNDKCARWEIYEMTANDQTGRIAQLATTCPGILIIARGIGTRDKHALDELLAMIVSGVRLGRILNKAVNLWARFSESETDLHKHQRTRIACAGPLIPADLLWAQPVGQVVIEDVPDDPTENLKWYLLQAYAKSVAGRLPGSKRNGFFSFVSRHTPSIITMLRINPDECVRHAWPNIQLSEIIDYIMATARFPKRATSLERLIGDSRAWHQRQRYLEAQQLEVLVFAPGLIATLRLWKSEHGEISFISNGSQLRKESERMCHCVASYAGEAASGKVKIFHGDFIDEQATIAIRWEYDLPVIIQATGVSNAPLSERARKIVEAWLADLTEAIKASQNGKKPVLSGRFVQPADNTLTK
ncbi:MAG: PcfJ domain-containing protein [Candidatus Riflebacteria bacterium]|nr:PcfJ domain-containing protein [Candidatus Riflebacteria bacterium]